MTAVLVLALALIAAAVTIAAAQAVRAVAFYVRTWVRLTTLCTTLGIYDSHRQAERRSHVSGGHPTAPPERGSVWPSVRRLDGLPESYRVVGRIVQHDDRLDQLVSQFEHFTGRPWTWRRRPLSRVIEITQAPLLPEIPAHPEPMFLAPWVLPVGDTTAGPALWDVTSAYHCLVVARTGWRKALALDTPIPTPNGWTTMGDLRPGDQVFNEQGQPCTVLYATEAMHGHTCYAVDFSDGETIVADAGHEWLTETRGARRSAADRRRVLARPVRFPGKDQPWKRTEPARVTTEQIRETLHVRTATTMYLNHSIPVAGPLQYPTADLPVDPYVLGAWLGDGYSSGAVITTADSEIIAEIESAGYEVRPANSQNSSKATNYRIYGLQRSLRLLGVLGNKHIPRVYLQAPVPQRLALLQGLMDTDGAVQAMGAGACRFAVTRQVLAEQTLELIVSLGIKARIRTSAATLNGKHCGTEYAISFTTDQPALRLPRKLNRQKPGGMRDVQRRRYVTDVRPIASVPVRCIRVDSPGHLFLAGRSCIPTHNSSFAAWLAGYARSIRHWTVVAIDPEDSGGPVAWLTALKRLDAELEARPADTAPLHRYLVVIDEFDDVMEPTTRADDDHDTRTAVRRLVRKLLRHGGKRGLHVLALAQDPRAKAIGSGIRSKFTARAAGWLDQAEITLVLNRAVAHDRDGPPGRGWWAVPGAKPTEVQFHTRPVQHEQKTDPRYEEPPTTRVTRIFPALEGRPRR